MKLFNFFIFLFIIFFIVYSHEETSLHCTGKLSLFQVIECVLDHSPEYKYEKQELSAIAGRRIANAYLFPSNPILSFSQSIRTEPNNSKSYLNGEILVSQEIYLSAQRRAKIQTSEIEKAAQTAKIEFIRRNTIADTIKASIQYENSKLVLNETKELYKISSELYTFIQERVKKGLLAPIDLDLAEAEKIKMFKILQISKRNYSIAKSNLTVMMGIPFESNLEILDIPETIHVKKFNLEALLKNALHSRPEILLAEKNIQFQEKKTEVLKLQRIPNLTISGFVQKDGFNENVIGARASFPLTIWKTNRGEILENQAQVQKSYSLLEIQTHTIKQEVIQALSNFQSLEEEIQTYKQQSLERTHDSILALQKAIKMGQMNLKDALIIQQSLVNFKLSYLDTKRDWLVSGVELLRASGYPILEIDIEK